MEDEVSAEEALLQKLRESRRCFQRRMQQLLEKYNQPFEDAPLVQMSTLTYETPQGLRVWGGRLVKKKNKGSIQGSHVKTVSRNSDPVPATAGGDEMPASYPMDLGVDSKSSDVDATLYQEEMASGALTPAVPWSPLKVDLRRKYLTQVDLLLQDKGGSEYNHGDRNDTRMSLLTSPVSPPRPAHGCRGHVAEESALELAAPSRPCSTDMALVPRKDIVSLEDTSGSSFLSSQSFVAEDICNVTVSDLYAGMLHSMSRLLSVKPSCVISTKTFILQNRGSRRRHPCGSRRSRPHCRHGRHARRAPRETPTPCAEPGGAGRVLRERQNSGERDGFGQKMELKSGKAFPEANKLQIWKELKGTPPKLSPSISIDCSLTHHLDWENRLMTLKWLISPVKVVSRQRVLQGEGGNHYRQFEGKFDVLPWRDCPSPGKRLCLTCLPKRSFHRGGPGSLGGPHGSETHWRSRPFSKLKAKSLNEAFENLDKQAIETGRCWPRYESSPSHLKANPAWNPGHSERTDGRVPGNHLGIFRKSVSLGKAISVPRAQPLCSERDRYNEIKEKFDQLHQKYCQKSPRRTKVPLCTEASLYKASMEVQNHKDFSGKLNPDSGFQGPQKLLSSPKSCIKSSLGSTTVKVHPSLCFTLAARCSPQPLGKRRRLSDPQVCGRWANSQAPFPVVGGTSTRPGEEAGSFQPYWEKKKKGEHSLPDGQ